MKKFVPVSLALVGALGLGSMATGASAQDYYRGYATPCAQQAHRNGTTGAVLGALAGAALGSNMASHHGGRSGGALIGALAGAVVGNNIGRAGSADRCDGGYAYGYGYAPVRNTGWRGYDERYRGGDRYRGYDNRQRGYGDRYSGYDNGYDRRAYEGQDYQGWR